MEFSVHSNCLEDTLKLASKLAIHLNRKDIILLQGDLGAGKTAFAKGIGLGLNIKDTVISPTFNIVRCYFDGRIPMYHIDAYRLEGINTPIGLEEYLEGDGVCLVEWSEYIMQMIPNNYLKIIIDIIDDNKRIYKFISNTPYYDKLLEDFKNEL